MNTLGWQIGAFLIGTSALIIAIYIGKLLNTTNKVVIAGGNVVLTDSENNIISETKVPEKATVNTDTQSVVITLIANEQTNRIVVNLNETITADFLKTHIEIEENYVIEGFYTDAQYTNEFNFSNPVSADTTIYAKISEAKQEVPETTIPETTQPEKDETPKTGAENYIVIAVLIAIISTIGIINIKKKEKIG